MRKCRDHGIEKFPRVVAELGPGDSLGMGLAAVISGADQYFAFDVVEHANNESNLEVFDELVELFRQRSPIPDADEFPQMHPTLDSYEFPHDILPDEHLERVLDENRIQRLRSAVMNTEAENSPIKYIVPWADTSILGRESVDMIFSQAVLEHVDLLEEAYQSMRAWLKPDGFMSHEIDFKCHGAADEWNGHWTYSDLLWKFMRGKRPWYINRQPHSVHLNMLQRTGFEIRHDDPNLRDSTIDKKSVARSLRNMTDEDLVTSTAFIIALPNAAG